MPNGRLRQISKKTALALTIAWMAVCPSACLPPAATAVSRPGISTIRPPHDIDALAWMDDQIWAGGRDGIIGLDLQGQPVANPVLAESEIKYVKSLCADSQGRLWIAYEKGLAVFDGQSVVQWTTADGLPDNRVNVVYEDHKGRLWIGTWSGVLLLDGDQKQVLGQADGLLNEMVNVILESSDGSMWFGSYTVPGGGVSILTATGWQYFHADNGLPNNNVTAMMQDADGRVWIGTGFYDLGGAARLVKSGSQWLLADTLSQSDGLAGAKVRSLFQADDGSIWLGSEYDGLAILKDGQYHLVTTTDGLANDEIKTLLQDEAGLIWIGTRDGITRINPVEFP